MLTDILAFSVNTAVHSSNSVFEVGNRPFEHL